jgi:hypothetical protein
MMSTRIAGLFPKSRAPEPTTKTSGQLRNRPSERTSATLIALLPLGGLPMPVLTFERPPRPRLSRRLN